MTHTSYSLPARPCHAILVGVAVGLVGGTVTDIVESEPVAVQLDTETHFRPENLTMETTGTKGHTGSPEAWGICRTLYQGKIWKFCQCILLYLAKTLCVWSLVTVFDSVTRFVTPLVHVKKLYSSSVGHLLVIFKDSPFSILWIYSEKAWEIVVRMQAAFPPCHCQGGLLHERKDTFSWTTLTRISWSLWSNIFAKSKHFTKLLIHKKKIM